jgi:hypothetical protein
MQRSKRKGWKSIRRAKAEAAAWSRIPNDIIERILTALYKDQSLKATLTRGPLTARLLLGSRTLRPDGDAYRLVALALGLERSADAPTWQSLVVSLRDEWMALPRFALFDQKGTYTLLYAVAHTRLRLADACIALGGDVHRRDCDGSTVLFLACRKGSAAMVEKLLAAGADVNQSNAGLCSPLRVASKYGHVDVARALIRANANVHAQNLDHENALEAALARGHPEVARVLVAAKADIVDRRRVERTLWNHRIRDALLAARDALLAARDALRARGDDGPRDAPVLAAMLQQPRMRLLLELDE